MSRRPEILPLALFGGLLLGTFSMDAPAADEKLRTVIIGLQGRRGVDEGLALAMSDIVQGEVTMDRSRKVFGRTDIIRLLEFESEKQALGCVDDSCLAEIAAGLDVSRIITGSIDKVGSGYFVVITEFDSANVEPVARVQGRVPLDEDRLIYAVTDLTQKLLRQSGSLASGAPTRGNSYRPSPPQPLAPRPAPRRGPAGISITTTPPGAVVLLDGKTYGQAPVQISPIPPGNHELVLQQDGQEAVRMDVPVYAGSVTEITGTMNRPARISSADLQRWEKEKSNQRLFGFLKIGGGVASCIVAPVCAFGSLAVAFNLFGVSDPVGFGSLAVGTGIPSAIGLGLCGWGASNLLFNPDRPSAEGREHEITISPPRGRGDAKTRVFQEDISY